MKSGEGREEMLTNRRLSSFEHKREAWSVLLVPFYLLSADIWAGLE